MIFAKYETAFGVKVYAYGVSRARLATELM